MFDDLKSLISAYTNKEFNPDDYDWYVRGSELFVKSRDGRTVYYRFCGEMAEEICAVFGVEPEAV